MDRLKEQVRYNKRHPIRLIFLKDKDIFRKKQSLLKSKISIYLN